MSKKITSSYTIKKTASSSVKVSSSSTSYEYTSTTNISNSSNTVNNDYKLKSNMMKPVQDRLALNKSNTKPVGTSHTPEHQSRPRSSTALTDRCQITNTTNAVASKVPTQNSPNHKQGYALILNHYEFKNGYPTTREGTQTDVNSLQIVFKEYNIDTVVKHDLILNDINREVKNLSNKDFTQYKCFIIVILTHGEGEDILSAKDKSYNFVEHIVDPLLTANKSLVDIPKIFIIQACRGNVEMPVIQSDNVGSPPKRNIFKCYATYGGYVSFRHITNGTFFIQSLCKMLKKYGRTETIYTIMMKLIDEVSKDKLNKQVPVVESLETPKLFCFGSLLN